VREFWTAAPQRALATTSPLAKPSASAPSAMPCASTATSGNRPSSRDLFLQVRARLVRLEHTPALWAEAGNPCVTYQKFDCFPMYEFSQKFKTFCLNSRATKFYPNLLASHLKLRIKLKHIKIILILWYKCELEFSWFLFRSFQLV
jgi:hypothetical protein